MIFCLIGALEALRRDIIDPDSMEEDENSAFEQRILDFATEGGGPANEVTLMGNLDHPLNGTDTLLPSNVSICITFIKANDQRYIIN